MGSLIRITGTALIPPPPPTEAPMEQPVERTPTPYPNTFENGVTAGVLAALDTVANPPRSTTPTSVVGFYREDSNEYFPLAESPPTFL